MKDWISRNIEGGPLALFIFVMVCAYGLGSLFIMDRKLQELRTTQHLIHIDGWVKASDLKFINIKEEK